MEEGRERVDRRRRRGGAVANYPTHPRESEARSSESVNWTNYSNYRKFQQQLREQIKLLLGEGLYQQRLFCPLSHLLPFLPYIRFRRHFAHLLAAKLEFDDVCFEAVTPPSYLAAGVCIELKIITTDLTFIPSN